MLTQLSSLLILIVICISSSPAFAAEPSRTQKPVETSEDNFTYDSTLAQWNQWTGNAENLCLAKPLYCGCDGYFTEPETSAELQEYKKTLSSTEKKEPFIGLADQYNYSFNGIAELAGNVVIEFDQLEVNAEEMKLDDEKSQANFTGAVQLKLPGFRLSGPKAQVSTKNQQASIDNAGMIFYQSGLRGTAEEIVLDGRKGLEIKNGNLTSCSPGNESWRVYGKNIDLDIKKGWGIVKHMQLKFGKVPVFYIPYFTFPLDDRRKSGLLVPRLDLAEPDISWPYYFNLAPNYDLTLTPRFIGGRGNMLQTEVRYLSEDYEGRIYGDILPSDDQREELGFDSERSHFLLEHSGNAFERWNYDIHIEHVSDSDYFIDFGDSLNSQSQTFLDKSFNVRYVHPRWSFFTRFQAYQVLDETLDEANYPYRRLPEMQLGHFGRLTEQLPIFWENKFNYVYFEQPRALVPTAHRLGWHSILSAPFDTTWGAIEPKLELNHRIYSLSGDVDEDNLSYTLPTASLDSKMVFNRKLGSHYLQTLEPRAFYTYTPYEDQSAVPLFDTSQLTLDYDQLFLSNPFIGGDRIADRQQVSFGLTSRIFDERNGRVVLQADLGQGFILNTPQTNDLNENLIDDDRTPIISRLSFTPHERLAWTTQVNWQDNTQGLYSASSRVSYFRPRPDYLAQDALNFEYRYRQEELNLEEINQYEISAAHTLNHNFKLLGKVRYDNRQNRTFEHLIGVSYSNCCWQASVVYHRLIESDETSLNATGAEHSILFEFRLKSLGGLGGGLGGFLTEQIPGYEDRRY